VQNLATYLAPEWIRVNTIHPTGVASVMTQNDAMAALMEQAANFAWGDADFSTLYFCGRSSIYRLKMKVKGFVPYVAYAKPPR